MSTNMTPFPRRRLEEDESIFDRRLPMKDKRVRLPDGRQGTVYMLERDVGGSDLVASIRIEGAKEQLFGLIKPKPVRFADEQIDMLTEIPTEEEVQAILDDPEQLGLED